MQWFDVDKAGLAKVLARKGKEFVLFELVQNAWDEDTRQVQVGLQRIPGTKYAHLMVEDDSPNGFADLSHAFTLFADSAKNSPRITKQIGVIHVVTAQSVAPDATVKHVIQ